MKLGCSPIDEPWRRNTELAKEWNVPPATAAALLADQLLGAPQHLLGRAPGEGQQQDGLRGHPPFDQARDPIDQRAGLARPRPSHHQQRAVAMGNRFKLRRVEQFGVVYPV